MAGPSPPASTERTHEAGEGVLEYVCINTGIDAVTRARRSTTLWRAAEAPPSSTRRIKMFAAPRLFS